MSALVGFGQCPLPYPCWRSIPARGLGVLRPGEALVAQCQAASPEAQPVCFSFSCFGVLISNRLCQLSNRKNNLGVPQTASRNAARRDSGLCAAKMCTEGNVTLCSDDPAASWFMFPGESFPGEPWGRLEMLLLGVTSGPAPSLFPGQCAGNGSSSITGTSGKCSSCPFPLSVFHWLLQRAVQGCGMNPGAWAWPGKSCPECPMEQEQFPFPSMSQGRAERSS